MPYQVYVATSMLAKEDFIVAVQLVAGQGKTFIILILVKKHLQLGHKCCIVVPNDDLKRQYEKDFRIYFNPNDNVTIVSSASLRFTVENHDIFFVDEADKICRDHAYGFKKVGDNAYVTGLPVCLMGQKTYMMSATYGKYDT